MIIYRCRECGHVIYIFRNVGQDSFGIMTPSELKARITPRCPKCGRELGTKPEIKVRIRASKEGG